MGTIECLVRGVGLMSVSVPLPRMGNAGTAPPIVGTNLSAGNLEVATTGARAGGGGALDGSVNPDGLGAMFLLFSFIVKIASIIVI